MSTLKPCRWCGVHIWVNDDGSVANTYRHGDDCPTVSTDLMIRKLLNAALVAERQVKPAIASIDELQAEIERLRAELERTRQAWVDGEDPMCEDVCVVECKGPCGHGTGEEPTWRLSPPGDTPDPGIPAGP